MKTVDIHQECTLPGSPHEVFEAWMDSVKHASFTNGEAKITRKVGGAFTTFDGWATGTTTELLPDKRIVQHWRASDWPEGALSTITIELAPELKGTRLRFTQTGVPSMFAKSIAQGWHDFYWKPLAKFLR